MQHPPEGRFSNSSNIIVDFPRQGCYIGDMEYYYNFNRYLKETNKSSKRIWRVPLSTGAPCPNKIEDRPGCTFCSESTFLPRYMRGETPSLKNQLEKGMSFFGELYKTDSFYGYFQENTSTYGELNELAAMYDYVLAKEEIKGLIISTRPDFINEDIIKKIEELAAEYGGKDIWIELGLQTTYDRTLERIKRGHSYEDFCNAVRLIKANSTIKIGVHTILGLPGESPAEMEEGYRRLFRDNPIEGVKFRLLEIEEGTLMADDYREHPEEFYQFSLPEYISLLCTILEHIPPEVVIMRLANRKSLQQLKGVEERLTKNSITDKLAAEFRRRGTKQGSLYGR